MIGNCSNVASYLNNLAGLLRDTNRLAEAEPMFRRALTITEASLGSDHPDVAIRLNNLAGLLQASDRPDEAEQMYRRSALILLRASQASGHWLPNTSVGVRNWAGALLVLGQTGEQVGAAIVALLTEAGLDPETVWDRIFGDADE
ncbi:MAG: tetratricopeptide repeat protein [Sandarakinorhabdus sp.]